jgi:hypothetical protein
MVFHLGFGFGNFGGLAVAAVAGMVYGSVAGVSFAVILSLTEHRRSLDQLSLKRVGIWGGIGGATMALLATPAIIGAGIPLYLLTASYLVPLGITALLGAGFAAGSVALAQQADTKLIEGSDEPLPALEEE